MFRSMADNKIVENKVENSKLNIYSTDQDAVRSSDCLGGSIKTRVKKDHRKNKRGLPVVGKGKNWPVNILYCVHYRLD